MDGDVEANTRASWCGRRQTTRATPETPRRHPHESETEPTTNEATSARDGADAATPSRPPGRERGRDGKFGRYGGQYVPEALMPAIEELTDAYERYVLGNEDGFMDEFRDRLADFGGRPTPLQRADRLSERYDREVFLKREDLLHGGAHKLNNALGQVLLAKYMGKRAHHRGDGRRPARHRDRDGGRPPRHAL